jgi:hypothetical protein
LSFFYGTDPNGDALNCSVFTGSHFQYGIGSYWMSNRNAQPGRVYIIDSMFYAFNGGQDAYPKNFWDPSQNVNPCDPTTFLDPTPGAYENAIGILADTWGFTCGIIPSSAAALRAFNPYNFQAIIWHSSACSNAPKSFFFESTPAEDQVFNGVFLVTTSFSANVQDGKMRSSNVMFTDSEQYYWPAGQPGNLYGDTCDLGGRGGLPDIFYETSSHPAALGYAYPENSGGPLYDGPIGWLLRHPNATMYARIGSRRSLTEEAFNSGGSIAFFRIECTIYVCLFLLSCVAFYKIPRKVSWVGCVIVLEGFINCAWRSMQLAQEPIWMKPKTEFFFGNLTEYFSLPWGNTSTVLAALIWVRVVLGLRTSKELMIFNLMTALLALGTMGACLYMSLVFPIFPWNNVLQVPFFTLRAIVNETFFAMQITFGAVFSVATAVGIFKVSKVAANSANSAIIGILKRMLPWIILQLLGFAFLCWGLWLYSHNNLWNDYTPGFVWPWAQHMIY